MAGRVIAAVGPQADLNPRSVGFLEAGAGLGDVVRTRMFVTDIGQWEAIGRAHGEAFGDVLPATAMVEVSQLIDPDMLVEIEADAIVGE